MKHIIFCSLIFSFNLVLGDDSTPTNGAGGTNAAPVPVAPPPQPPITVNPGQGLTAQFEARTSAVEIRNELVAIAPDADQGTWDAIAGKVDGYESQYGNNPATANSVVALRKIELAVAKKSTDPARFPAVVKQLSTDALPAVAELAKPEQAKLDRMANLKTVPLELKYTASDGSAVDLSKLRGKVVLIDFWASWCAPYADAAPDIVAAYKKYHDQGFEIIGISLDEDKEQMQTFMQQKGMTWPQYFDGKKWDNEVSRSFDINSLPVEWLVDKKGMLVSTDVRQDLAGQIETLLKAP